MAFRRRWRRRYRRRFRRRAERQRVWMSTGAVSTNSQKLLVLYANEQAVGLSVADAKLNYGTSNAIAQAFVRVGRIKVEFMPAFEADAQGALAIGPLVFAVVYVPQQNEGFTGTPLLNVPARTGVTGFPVSLYEPNQHVIMSGTVGPATGYKYYSRKVVRLRSGDYLALIIAVPDGARGLVQCQVRCDYTVNN